MNLPIAFENNTRKLLGDEWPQLLSALSSESPTSIRLNPNKHISLDIDTKVPWTDAGFYLNERPKFTFDPLFHAGCYYVQEASSMFLEQAVKQSMDLSHSSMVLDLCAAPGGKSTHLASLLSKDSLLISNEVIRQRANILSENVTKWGNPNIIVTNNDPRDFRSFPPIFDMMVVDAPCSGEGMFRKDKAAINEWSESNVQLCSERQRRILADVWDCLKVNGVLIYSTCTYNQQENEENLQWLQSQCSIESVELNVPQSWGIKKTKLNGLIGYRFYPHNLDGEGFFIAVLRKTEGSEAILKPKKKSNLTKASKTEKQLAESLVNTPQLFEFYKNHEDILVFPTAHQAIAELVRDNLYIIQLGTSIASVKKNGLVPQHGLAMSTALNKNLYPIVEVDLKEAIQYLRKENLAPDAFENGWNIIQFKGWPLGFTNRIGNRTNNYYPKEWRIRSGWEGS